MTFINGLRDFLVVAGVYFLGLQVWRFMVASYHVFNLNAGEARTGEGEPTEGESAIQSYI